MKNLAGKERWIIIKEMPRRQEQNPKFAPKLPSPEEHRDDSIQENIRRARLRSEPMIFTPDEVIMAGDMGFTNFLFSADNPDKFCCMRNELPYLIEQGYIQALPYTRQMIDNLKVNWAKDPAFDLYEFPGADEYWDELKAYQDEKKKFFSERGAVVEKLAASIASMPISKMNFELQLISLIAARESDPVICIKQAKDIIFEIAREQYSLQTTEDKKNDNKSRKLGPKKQSGGTEQPAATGS